MGDATQQQAVEQQRESLNNGLEKLRTYNPYIQFFRVNGSLLKSLLRGPALNKMADSNGLAADFIKRCVGQNLKEVVTQDLDALDERYNVATRQLIDDAVRKLTPDEQEQRIHRSDDGITTLYLDLAPEDEGRRADRIEASGAEKIYAHADLRTPPAQRDYSSILTDTELALGKVIVKVDQANNKVELHDWFNANRQRHASGEEYTEREMVGYAVDPKRTGKETKVALISIFCPDHGHPHIPNDTSPPIKLEYKLTDFSEDGLGKLAPPRTAVAPQHDINVAKTSAAVK